MIKNEKTVSAELEKFIRENDLKISVDDIKKSIFEETGSPMDAVTKFLKMCQGQVNKDAFTAGFGLFQDAWNFYPHKNLNGKSPSEVSKIS